MDASQRRRRVGVLVKVFPKLSETFILEELLGLERAGVALRLYTLADPTDAVVHADVARLRARPQRVPSAAWAAWRPLLAAHARLLLRAPLRYLRQAARAWWSGGAAREDFVRAGWLAQRLRADGVDHLHVHFIDRTADLAAAAATMAGLAFSISAHAKDIYLSPPAALRRRLAAARFTVTCTDFNCAALRALAPGQAPIHRMYHGVDATRFAPCGEHAAHSPSRVDACRDDDGVPLLLSVGRLRAKKGLDLLIDACALLRQRGRRLRCEIVGYGEQHGALQQRIASHGLADCVHLVGKLTRDQVIERYARAALYVQPSRVTADGDRDGIPNVLLEAMAMALPVVATRVSGIPELVADGLTGALVEPDDAQALAAACERLLDDRALAAAIGAAGRQRVLAQFDNDRNLQLLRRLLDLHDSHDEHAPSVARAAAV